MRADGACTPQRYRPLHSGVTHVQRWGMAVRQRCHAGGPAANAAAPSPASHRRSRLLKQVVRCSPVIVIQQRVYRRLDQPAHGALCLQHMMHAHKSGSSSMHAYCSLTMSASRAHL